MVDRFTWKMAATATLHPFNVLFQENLGKPVPER